MDDRAGWFVRRGSKWNVDSKSPAAIVPRHNANTTWLAIWIQWKECEYKKKTAKQWDMRFHLSIEYFQDFYLQLCVANCVGRRRRRSRQFVRVWWIKVFLTYSSFTYLGLIS